MAEEACAGIFWEIQQVQDGKREQQLPTVDVLQVKNMNAGNHYSRKVGETLVFWKMKVQGWLKPKLFSVGQPLW